MKLERLQDTRPIHRNQFSFHIKTMNNQKLKFKNNNSIYNSIKNKIIWDKSEKDVEYLYTENCKMLLRGRPKCVEDPYSMAYIYMTQYR